MSDPIFPNAKPKLLGEGEDSIGIIDTPAVAGLTGSVTLAKDTDQGITPINATQSSSSVTSRIRTGNDGVALITFSNVTTPTDSILIIVIASSTFLLGNADKDWLLKRDTTTLDTFSLESGDSNSQNADMRVFVDANPTAGTFDYTLVEDDANTFGGMTMTLFFIKANDTHAGFIDTVAIAGKQINAEDSHRTHEQAVLPD